ncbi:uncharacterized protein C8R40DRAFT_1169962 [Lentinula edodes]|uniref:uncharacterized protein n=1 Tax=Lentinula edodes TaxID=5353 RepID=UPI001E8D53E9|nr:uncharacterized protein C8R40DRAFT_1169962 [Lentinula edodes]KAH7875829.1 hypothetical protein C8R40DRAFT_1169962 [Lentinula edodes]
MSSTTKKQNTLINRGSTESAPLSRTIFVLARALDLPLQYAILSSRSLTAPLIHALGGTAILPTGRPLFLMGTNTGLSPQRAILFGMALGSFVKQSHWINTILFTNTATSVLAYPTVNGDETVLPVPTIFGLGFYALGMVLEWGSEIQRLRFKKNPRNKGRVYTKGLFGLARHINYGGYVLWRTGFAMAAAGWTWGLVTGAFYTYNFLTDGIPELDGYCKKRYTEEWSQYKRDVPYKLFPFIL